MTKKANSLKSKLNLKTFELALDAFSNEWVDYSFILLSNQAELVPYINKYDLSHNIQILHCSQVFLILNMIIHLRA